MCTVKRHKEGSTGLIPMSIHRGVYWSHTHVYTQRGLLVSYPCLYTEGSTGLIPMSIHRGVYWSHTHVYTQRGHLVSYPCLYIKGSTGLIPMSICRGVYWSHTHVYTQRGLLISYPYCLYTNQRIHKHTCVPILIKKNYTFTIHVLLHHFSM